MVRVDSLRKQVYEEWVKNPYITPKKTCEILGKSYKEHGNYIHKLLSEFRSYHQFGSPQEAHPFPEHRVFEWTDVPRELLPGNGELKRRLEFWGWRAVVNRNDMWVWRDPQGRGTVHWYQGGLVRVYLKGELQIARAKELFCRAFRWFEANDIRKFLDVPLKETYRKWTFELGQPIRPFDNRQFERSHGLRIFADGSHPTAYHVGESVPFWIDEQRQATQELGSVVREFGFEIREHMKLIRSWQEESQTRLKPIKRKEKHMESQKTILEWMIK